jgi:hypothetical protein
VWICIPCLWGCPGQGRLSPRPLQWSLIYFKIAGSTIEMSSQFQPNLIERIKKPTNALIALERISYTWVTVRGATPCTHEPG